MHIIISQQKYYNRDEYWVISGNIWSKQFAIWERLEGSANGDYGCVGINMICMHRYLKLSKRTSPYSIIKELREYFSAKIGSDIFTNIVAFEDWEKNHLGNRFNNIQHDFHKLI